MQGRCYDSPTVPSLFYGVQLSILASVILEEKQRKKASKHAKKRQLKKEVQIVETTPAESDEGEIWGMA